ncbi:MAG: BamA/TamA family outer membrane protein [Rhodobacteraceae bacterium]|nr:BamA/TamA family outer membrane protein [Paracoccaceae bacterium]
MRLKRVRAQFRALLLAGLPAAQLVLAQPAEALETTLTAPGAPEELQDTLRAASSVMGASAQQLDSAQELLAAALSDYRTLVQVLYDQGYFSPDVRIRLDGREAANIDPLNTPSTINKVEITVQTGPAFRFGTAKVAPLAPDTVLPEAFATGQPATTGAIRDAAQAGRSAWRHEGHAKAKIGEQRITANHAQSQINADIELLPGPQLTFGRLYTTGKTRVNPEALQKIAGFPTGEIFDPDDVQLVGTRLRRTGTFASVNLKEAETPNPDGSLDYTAEFTDLPQRRLTFGAELSSNDGLDVSATWMHRNLFGNAEKLSFEARAEGIGGDTDLGGRIGIRLDRPATLGPDDNVYYLAEVERLDEEHYTATRGLIGIGVRRVFSEFLIGEAAVSAVSTLATDVFGKRRFKYFVLPVQMEYDKRDSKISATRGVFLKASLTPFVGWDDTESGVQLKADGRYYQRLDANGRFVAAGRLQIGSVGGPSLQDIDPTLRFFSGGAGSVRGHPYESLGVVVPGGIAGGKSYVAASAELRGYVTEKMSLVGFYDFGIVGRDAFVSSGSNSHAGAGLGVRYDLGGFGPLRLDLAYPVSGPTDDGLQFYIGIGQAF